MADKCHFEISERGSWPWSWRESAYFQSVNKNQFAQLFARVTRRSPASAADEIDNLVYRMLKELKRPFARTPRERSTAAGSTDTNKQDR